MAKKLSDMPVGTLVKDIGTKYYGVPIVWKIADKNHSGYPANSVTLISDKILALKCFDANEPSNSDNIRKENGNSRYSISNIRQWLNSKAQAGQWYSPQHSTDAPPNSSNTEKGHNSYDKQAGFLNTFSNNFINALLTTTLTVARYVTDGGGSETLKDTIFLASNTEVGFENENGIVEGEKLALFSDNTSRIAYPTVLAVSNSQYTNQDLNSNSSWYWWLRTPGNRNSCLVNNAHRDGGKQSFGAHDSGGGIRPLCNLKSSVLVSDNPDTDGAYTIVWNRPPLKPNTITVPKNIYINKATNISWSSTTDPDNDRLSYVLERRINSDNWTQIYNGDGTSFNDMVSQKTANTVQYRVKAVDNFNNSSDYAVSQSATIIHNIPPTISGVNEDIGVKNNNEFDYKYVVSDVDSDTVNVVEKIDETLIKTYTAILGQENTLQISSKDWLNLPNGKHIIKIIATDVEGGVSTREITFTKKVDTVFVMLKNPLNSAYRPSRIKTTVEAQVPTDGQIRIEACNNGNDVNPTWEDITMFVKSNFAYVFTNNIKTSAEWAVNIKVIISRNNQEGDCYITKIEGNFE